jgi:hypothetical protein
LAQGLRGSGSLAANLEVRLTVDDLGKPLSEDGMVIDQEDFALRFWD